MTTDQRAVYDDEVKSKHLTMSGYNYFIKSSLADLYTHHGLCGYWSMNEKTGNQILDYSRNANHGTLKPSYPDNCPSRVSSFSKKYGNALYFDGDDDYVDAGNDASLDIKDAITIEAWIYYQGGRSYPRINDKYPAPSINIEQVSDRLAWYSEIGSSLVDFRFPNTIISRDVWSHIVVTYANDAEHAIKAYVNGQLKDTKINFSGQLSTTATHLVIGNRLAQDRTFNGLIDEVRIYNRALSLAETLKHYNLLRLGKLRQSLPLH